MTFIVSLISKTIIDTIIVYIVLKPMIFKGRSDYAKQLSPVFLASLSINIFMLLELDKAIIFLILAYFIANAIGERFFRK